MKREDDRRRNRGCPVPALYLTLQLVAVGLILFIAYYLHVPATVLAFIFAGVAFLASIKTVQVCQRQKIYPHQ